MKTFFYLGLALCVGCGDTTYVLGGTVEPEGEKTTQPIVKDDPGNSEKGIDEKTQDQWPKTTCVTGGLILGPGEGLGSVSLEATASEVRAHFVCEPSFDQDAFAYHYPELGLSVVFNDADLDQELDDSEVVREYVVEAPFVATTAKGLGLGSAQKDVEAQYGTPVEFAHPEGPALWFVEEGVQFAIASSVVHRIAIFRRQPGILTSTIIPATARLDGQPCDVDDSLCLSVQAAYANSDGFVGTTLTELRAMLADVLPDIDSLVESGAGVGHVVTYAHLGITAIALLFGAVDNVSVLVLHEPYAGVTALGHGIASLRSEIESELGAPTSSGEITVYSIGTPVGVILPVLTGKVGIVYEEDRAKNWVLNYNGL